jgi:hypothetical protein
MEALKASRLGPFLDSYEMLIIIMLIINIVDIYLYFNFVNQINKIKKQIPAHELISIMMISISYESRNGSNLDALRASIVTSNSAKHHFSKKMAFMKFVFPV